MHAIGTPSSKLTFAALANRKVATTVEPKLAGHSNAKKTENKRTVDSLKNGGILVKCVKPEQANKFKKLASQRLSEQFEFRK